MGLTVTLAGDWLTNIGNRMASRATVAFDSVYPTGGESLTPAMLGLGVIEHIEVPSHSGYTFAYDFTTQKLLAYTTGATTPEGTIEVTKPTFTVAASGAIGTDMEIGLSSDADAATVQGGVGITVERVLGASSPVGTPTATFTGTVGSTELAEVANATDLATLTGVLVYAIGR